MCAFSAFYDKSLNNENTCSMIVWSAGAPECSFIRSGSGGAPAKWEAGFNFKTQRPEG